jgi:hydroxyacid-oxoacid transhydrogenase
MRRLATPGQALPVDKEYAFEVRTCTASHSARDLPLYQVAASNLRFGSGVTAEVGMDFKNMKARKVRSVLYPTIYVLNVRYRSASSRTPTSPDCCP